MEPTSAALTALCLSLALLAQLTSAAADAEPTVLTTSGLLTGLLEPLAGANASVFRFHAVPYAEPPVGPLRFRPPRDLAGPPSTAPARDARQAGPTCAQFRHLGRFVSPLLQLDAQHRTSEDCLTLNLAAPAQASQPQAGARLPVLVWLPGEGFDFADARQFDAGQLAHRARALVVTVQYRVGVLGFLRAPQLGAPGNMGLQDQLSALRWLRRNAAAFGGDPDRVTLMGRFSGAMSISALLTAPNQSALSLDGRPLFRRAALLSGVAVSEWIIDSQPERRLAQLMEKVRSQHLCTSSELADGSCLQRLPAEQLLAAADYGWRLVRDGQLVGAAGSPADAVRAGRLPDHLEALLLGQTANEGTLCLYRHLLAAEADPAAAGLARQLEGDQLTSSSLFELISDDSRVYFRPNEGGQPEEALRSTIESLLQLAPAGEPSLRDLYLTACSSYMVKAHSRRFKRSVLARNQLAATRMDAGKLPVRVHHYELRYKPSFSLAPEYVRTAAHGDDVPLILGLAYNGQPGAVSEADLLMSRRMVAMLASFLHGHEEPGQLGRRQPGFGGEAQLRTLELTEADQAELLATTRTAAQQQQPQQQQPQPQQHLLLVAKSRHLAGSNLSSLHEQVAGQLLLSALGPQPEPDHEPQRPLPLAATDSSFVAALLAGALASALAIMLACGCLCFLLLRNNLAAGKSLQSLQSLQSQPPPSCQMCEPDRRGSHQQPPAANEAPAAHDKQARDELANVFAKLRGQAARPTHQAAPAQQQNGAQRH